MNIVTIFAPNKNSERHNTKMNLLLITSVNAMAQHDHHDLLSTTWLLDTGRGHQSFVPKVSAHYEGENILLCSSEQKNNKRIRINSIH
jgi:hypothetical protein